MDGARITLLPSVETGLLTQRPEQSVMQALESLNDGQVNDFLTGKAPLNLTMRLGDHMMLIQLQLSTVSPGGSRKTRLQPTHSHTHTHAHTHNHAHTHTHTHSHTHTHAHTHSHLDHGGAARTSAHAHALTPPYTPHATCSGYSPVHTSHLSSQSSIPASVTINPSQTASSNSTVSNSPSSPSSTSSSTSSSPSSASATLHHQHNLLHHYHHHHHHSMGCGSPSSPPPPYLATPPHHHHHHHHHHLRPTPGTPTTPTSPTSSSSSGSNTSSPSGLGFDGELPVRGCPHRGEETDPRASLDTKALAEASRNLTQTLKQLSSEVLTSKPEQKEDTITPHEVATASLGSLGGSSSSSSSNSSSGNSSSSSTSSGSSSISSGSNGNGSGCSSGGGGSSSNSSSASSSSSSSSSGSGGIKKQGAIIESMHHHGKGVYSGTFSGTLNPALQDRQGRPKRDISTIIHILNDLLCATPQYRRHSTNISLSTSTPTTSRSKNSGGIAKRGTQQNGGASTSELHMQDSATHRNSGKCADNAQTMEHDSGDENQAMRTKVEQLRLIMEQRRARRKARRDARTRPYPHTSASWATDTSVPTVVATSSTAPASTTQAMDVDGSKADGTDPATLCELNSETVVA
ncbi:midnolin homolog isoform X2 [Procambarus clarkii]